MQEFHDAMRQRFSMINVKKNQGALMKKQDMSIHNEIKLITSSNEVHGLWMEVISSQSNGLLIDPETLLPYKDTKSWDATKDGVISCEFFRWLGNLPESGFRKLALHLLNRIPNRSLPHPKVTLKKISGVMVDCYSTKEWLEQNKRKQAIRKYLYFEKRNLGFFDSAGNYKLEACKAFKKKYNVTKATKYLLLMTPKEEFFLQVKRPANKNKSARVCC